jgi:hypothetical protein
MYVCMYVCLGLAIKGYGWLVRVVLVVEGIASQSALVELFSVMCALCMLFKGLVQ